MTLHATQPLTDLAGVGRKPPSKHHGTLDAPLERSHPAKLLWLLWHGEALSAAELERMGVGAKRRLTGVWDAAAVEYADTCEAQGAKKWLPTPQPINAELNTKLRKALPLGDGRFM